MAAIELKFFRAHPYLKLRILFYSNSLAIWLGYPDITILELIMHLIKLKFFRAYPSLPDIMYIKK